MKKISKVLVLLTMVICLSGCMKIKVEMDVKSSTEMTMKMDYVVEEKFLTMSGMTSEQFIEQMKTSMGDAAGNAKITPKNETIDGDKWVGMTITGAVSEKEMKEFLSEKEIDGKKCVVLTLAKDFMSGSQFGGMDTDKIQQQTGYSIDKLKTLGMEMSITVNMPADAKTNFGKVDGKKVTIDLLELSSKASTIQKIEISSPLSNGFDMTYVFIGLGAVVLIGIVAFMLKKKKTPEVVEIDSMPQVSPAQERTPDVVEEQTQDVAPEASEETVQEATPEVTQEPVQDVTPKVTETNTEQPSTQTNEAAIYCPNCGEKVSAEDTFCQKCGFGLKK